MCIPVELLENSIVPQYVIDIAYYSQLKRSLDIWIFKKFLLNTWYVDTVGQQIRDIMKNYIFAVLGGK